MLKAVLNSLILAFIAFLTQPVFADQRPTAACSIQISKNDRVSRDLIFCFGIDQIFNLDESFTKIATEHRLSATKTITIELIGHTEDKLRFRTYYNYLDANGDLTEKSAATRTIEITREHSSTILSFGFYRLQIDCRFQ